MKRLLSTALTVFALAGCNAVEAVPEQEWDIRQDADPMTDIIDASATLMATDGQTRLSAVCWQGQALRVTVTAAGSRFIPHSSPVMTRLNSAEPVRHQATYDNGFAVIHDAEPFLRELRGTAGMVRVRTFNAGDAGSNDYEFTLPDLDNTDVAIGIVLNACGLPT